MKFLCDQMLVRLGRWLRVAGYDTIIAKPGEMDQEILHEALKEHRLLLTRDKHFSEMTEGRTIVIYLTSNSVEECIRELNITIKLNWLYHPFTRCLDCNSLLIEPDVTSINLQVPLDIRAKTTKFLYCTACKKVFWEGSHTVHMLKQLQHWQKLT